jgi:hypothetical protein
MTFITVRCGVCGRGRLAGSKVVTGRRIIRKKEEFPGFMKDMRPGNSFPQICVVSVQYLKPITQVIQEYGRIMAFSNRR